ncbi:type 1 glutamine amidotransferase [Halorussus amylolyticus]|uniref:type 1 glutamine amidotransferase n=1 Tax=Halorussus amylolyticus TaxID=1126242 RepID=UPI00104A1299|nr:type 1 glutamine amidotransferase [Halorussus amylolyticus]
MLLVLENEVDPDTRYFVPEIVRYLSEHDVYTYADEGGQPSVEDVDGVVISGSTAGVYDREDYPWMDEQAELVRELVEREIPTLGVCFGHQIINHALGGRVEHRGLTNRLVRADFDDDPLFSGVNDVVPMVHGDHVVERGDGMERIGSADYYENLATRHRDAPVWTVQYHPEFTDRLLGRIRDDFGWEETDLSFSDVSVEETFRNFERLASE